MERTINEDNMTKIICAVMTEILFQMENEGDEKYLERVGYTFNKMCDIVLTRMNA